MTTKTLEGKEAVITIRGEETTVCLSNWDRITIQYLCKASPLIDLSFRRKGSKSYHKVLVSNPIKRDEVAPELSIIDEPELDCYYEAYRTYEALNQMQIKLRKHSDSSELDLEVIEQAKRLKPLLEKLGSQNLNKLEAKLEPLKDKILEQMQKNYVEAISDYILRA